jgi:hypothetical protein
MASLDIEKWRQEERVRIANLKNRGDVLAIVADTHLPIEYVQKTLEKIKKRRERNVAVLVAESLMVHILDGYEQRTRFLVEIMKSLESRDQVMVSICCQVPVKVTGTPESGRSDIYECIKCHKRCEAQIADREFIYSLKHKTIEMLRDEDKALAAFAADMGFTNDKMPGIMINQNILMMRGKKKEHTPAKNEIDLDPSMAKEIANLPMHDRELLIKRLDKQIAGITDEDVAADGEIVNGSDNGNGSKLQGG